MPTIPNNFLRPPIGMCLQLTDFWIFKHIKHNNPKKKRVSPLSSIELYWLLFPWSTLRGEYSHEGLDLLSYFFGSNSYYPWVCLPQELSSVIKKPTYSRLHHKKKKKMKPILRLRSFSDKWIESYQLHRQRSLPSGLTKKKKVLSDLIRTTPFIRGGFTSHKNTFHPLIGDPPVYTDGVVNTRKMIPPVDKKFPVEIHNSILVFQPSVTFYWSVLWVKIFPIVDYVTKGGVGEVSPLPLGIL